MAMSIGTKGVKANINITPYIDILLVLLIIFMTHAPMKLQEHPIRVPQPAQKLQPKEIKNDSIIIDIDLDHSIKLNMQPITMEKLGSTLKQVFERRAVKNLFVRGDSNLPYGDVFPLLDIARHSGATDIALLQKTDKKNGPTQIAKK
jgi:biopolymer transport protein TolR